MCVGPPVQRRKVDLSNNLFSGEVPTDLFVNLTSLRYVCGGDHRAAVLGLMASPEGRKGCSHFVEGDVRSVQCASVFPNRSAQLCNNSFIGATPPHRGWKVTLAECGLVCPAGRQCPQHPVSAFGVPCHPGTFSPAGLVTCHPCFSGYACPRPGMEVPVPCPQFHFAKLGSAQCQLNVAMVLSVPVTIVAVLATARSFACGAEARAHLSRVLARVGSRARVTRSNGGGGGGGVGGEAVAGLRADFPSARVVLRARAVVGGRAAAAA